ncbi:MAG: hypothetical protein F9K27_02165 [Anaerolineae bacterium]|nr:MAG: hypothetical protein F9K27_02165 [Anaerolineae bacterium]
MKNLYIFLLVFITFFIGLPFPTPTAETPIIYWDGAGDTPPMSAYEQDGRYLRFTEFPILVYMPFDSKWESALENALQQVSAMVPIRRISDSTQADILISLVSPEDFLAATPCLEHQTEGCAVIRPVGHPGHPGFTVIGHLWLNTATALPPHHVLLHELIHALGLLVHSPYPSDVMYNGNDAFPTTLSLQDRATLHQLYTAPAWH